MATAESFLPADGENEWAIEPQGVDGGTASGAGADDRDSGPAKMGGPRIAPWVKECGIFPRLGIEPDLAGSFAQRAGDTGHCQILRSGLPTRNDWDDVVEVKGRLLADLSQSAIFATVAGALDHDPAQLARHWHGIKQNARSRARPAGATVRETPPD